MKFHVTYIVIAIIGLGMLAPFYPVVFAQPGSVFDSSGNPPQPPGTSLDQRGNNRIQTLQNPLKNITSVGSLVNKFVELFSYLVIIFAVIAIVWTGFQLILARGKPDKMTEASKRLGYILIGVAIVIGARIMVAVIINTLEATGTVNSETIRGARRGLDGR